MSENQGETGAQGSQGETGETGAQGETGERGPRGDHGQQGDQGDVGPIGPTGLTGAATALGGRIDALITTVQIAQEQIKKQKRIIKWMFVYGAVMLFSLGWVWTVSRDAKDAVEAIQANAVTNCENNNESRQAQVVLWDFILNASGRNDEEPRTPEEEAFRAAFQEWVHQLYAPRDCENLNKKYEIPPPPSIPGLTEEKS